VLFHHLPRALDAAEKALGPITVLINNAGIAIEKLAVEQSEADWDAVIGANLKGAYFLATELSRRMIARKAEGNIVNIASTMGESSVPGLVSYNASKAAVIRFTDAARLEFRRSGVKFSCVLPGAVNTELAAGISQPRLIRRLEPADVAAVVVRALESRRSHRRIYVPGSFGYLLTLLRLLPLSVGEFASRILGAERAVLRDSNLTARRNYQDRVSLS